MSSNQPNNSERIDQLMVDAATQGLDHAEAAELRDAIDRDPALQAEADAYELAATVTELALTGISADETLPASLRERLVADAAQHLPATPQGSAAQPELKLTGTPAAQPAPASQPEPAKFSFTDGRAFGWYVAAAALIALFMVIGQQPQGTSTDNTPPPQLTDAERYEKLADDDATVAADWGYNPDGGDQRFENAGGQVIFNPDQQTGFMKLTGLPVNDPTKEQYQLWIVDATRSGDETTDRIDGGVFNVNEAGEVIIPIDPKITARKPVVFAITVEQPGGVVVSKGPLHIVAAVEAG